MRERGKFVNDTPGYSMDQQEVCDILLKVDTSLVDQARLLHKQVPSPNHPVVTVPLKAVNSSYSLDFVQGWVCGRYCY